MISEDVEQATTVPHVAHTESKHFELTQVNGNVLAGSYLDKKTHNRFELRVQYFDGGTEWFSVLANLPYSGRSLELSRENCAFKVQLPSNFVVINFEFKSDPSLNFALSGDARIRPPNSLEEKRIDTCILFDVSDLVYYIGHHDNLTGIQRVQACVLLGLIQGCPGQRRGYITFDNRLRDFTLIDSAYFEALLHDLSLPVNARKVPYDRDDARIGVLPHAEPLATELTSKCGSRLVVYLLGAAWVNRDYFHRILELKRTYDASFCMTVHDLIPIFARDTCDQGTAIVFEEFLRKSFLFTDHYFAVSEHTALDLHKFAASIEMRNPPVSVIENGHALDEFFPFRGRKARSPMSVSYALFVSTIEGRKNHTYIFDVWSELTRVLPDAPILVCVGRFGWRAEQFLEKMLVTNNLSNKIRVLSEVSDAQLEALYENCLFTVYPSFYEGWGLPVGESLSKGKLCVLSDKSSLPEVAGEFGVYLDITSVQDGVEKLARLTQDHDYRLGLEQRLEAKFVPRTWKQVAAELASKVSSLQNASSRVFPLIKLGCEYKLAQLPPRSLTALGYAMITEVTNARAGAITGYVNRDEDLLAAQAMREGTSWYPPEDWGTWSRYPEASKVFYVEVAHNASELVIYEKLRVIRPLVGQSLRVTVNSGAPQEFSMDEEKFIIRIVAPVRADSTGVAEVRIRYELKYSREIIPTLENIDARQLGLGFESTAVVDDMDLCARVSMLERLLFGNSAGRILPRSALSSTMSIETVAGRGGGRKSERSLLVRSHSGVSVIESGDQRSLSSPLIEMGERIALTSGQHTRAGQRVDALLGRGWFSVEEAGVWSQGCEATIDFRLSQAAEAIFAISAEARCLASPERAVRLSVVVNSVVVGTEEFRDSEYRTLHYIVDQHISADDRAYVVLMHCDRLSSPADCGVSSDTRELGVHVRCFAARPIFSLRLNESYRVECQCEVMEVFSDGWHDVEAAGLWSREDGGRIVAALDSEPLAGDAQMNIRISIFGRVYGTSITGPAAVDLLIQGQVSASWTFGDDNLCTKQAVLPLIAIGDRDLLDVRIIRRRAISPSDAGESDDKRKLGLLVSEISFESAMLPVSTDLQISY